MPALDSRTPIDTEALGARAEALLVDLAKISAEPDRLVRLFLTPEHRRAANQVAAWMRDAGLTVTEDALGTVRDNLLTNTSGAGLRIDRARLLHKTLCLDFGAAEDFIQI